MLYFKQTTCISARNWLLEYYMQTFVKHAARRIASGLPSCIDADDLEQVGFFGLSRLYRKIRPYH